MDFRYFVFGYSLFSIWFFGLTFHLVILLIRAAIPIVVLVFCSNVPIIGLDRLGFVGGRQTSRVSDFCFFCQFGIASCRYGCYSRPRNCWFPPSAVFRLSLPRFYNRSQRRRDVISLTIPFALRSPWTGPLELSLFSVTRSLALRMNRLKVCSLFLDFCLGCT